MAMSKRVEFAKRTRDEARKYTDAYYAKRGREWMRAYWREQARKVRADPTRLAQLRKRQREWWRDVYVPRREADRENWADVRAEIIAQHQAQRNLK